MTTVTQLKEQPCPKIDAWDVDAYFKLFLDPVDERILKLDTSWGCTAVDLSKAIRYGETITHLFLTPETNPTSLQYNREDYGLEGAENGGVDCIHGDDLSRIISMRLLKDVDQTQRLVDGCVYMYNAITGLFEPFELKPWMKMVENKLENHEGRITNLEFTVEAIQQTIENIKNRLNNVENRLTQVESRLTRVEADLTALMNRVSAIENAIYNWGNDKTTKIARGQINVYGGTSQTVNKSRYIATHDPNTNVTGDCYFSG